MKNNWKTSAWIVSWRKADYRKYLKISAVSGLVGAKYDLLYFNPGSAGPRRFSLPVTVGRLRVTDSGVEGHIQELDAPGPRRRR